MRKRLPPFQAVLQVYAVIAVMFSAWTVTAFIWKLSAWLLLLDLGEIFALFSYAMASSLVESLIVLFILLAACVLLPAPLLRDHFVARGMLLSLGLLLSLMAFIGLYMRFGMSSIALLLIGPLDILLLTAFLLIFPARFRFVRFVNSVATWMSDRLVVFLFVLVPMFIVLSVYVIIRNMI